MRASLPVSWTKMFERVHVAIFIFLLFQSIFVVNSINLRWKKYEEILESPHIEKIFELLDPTKLVKNFDTINSEFKHVENFTCNRDLNIYKIAASKRNLWALKMLDASSKVPSGILNGNFIDYGRFEECIQSSGTITGIVIRGHYCTYDIIRIFNTQLPVKLRRAICIPRSCTANDLLLLLNRFINANSKLKDYGVSILNPNCIKIESETTNYGLFIVLFVVGVFIGFLTLCTVLDFLNRRNIQRYNNKLIQILVKFSYIKSTESIFNLETQEEFPVINGVRAISCASIVLFHQYILLLFVDNYNFLDIIEWYSSRFNIDAYIGVQGVENFFVLSSFLMAHSYYKKKNQNKKFNIVHHYLHRLFRLSLPIIITILFALFFIPVIGSGPKWEVITNIFVSGIQTKWWSAILYIFNFIERENFSLLHLWYISADMQLYWISPLVLYSLYKKPKIGLSIVISLIILSLIFTVWIIGINKYSSVCLHKNLNFLQITSEVRDIYLMTYTHITSWMFGILLGYEVSYYKNRKPSKIILYVGWIFTIATLVVCILSLKFMKSEIYQYNLYWEIIFTIFTKIMWPYIICWLIYTSIHNSTGIISSILSSKIFLPISKLSYCIYLTHLMVVLYQTGSSRVPTYFTVFSVYHAFIGNFFFSLPLAFVTSITFERPMLVLNDLLFRQSNKSIKGELKKS